MRRLFALLGALAVIGCGPTRAEPTLPPTVVIEAATTVDSDTTVASHPSMADVTVSEPHTCGDAFPVFPTAVRAGDGTADIDGTPGPAPDAAEAPRPQLVRHWVIEEDVVLEMRWPGGTLDHANDDRVISRLLRLDDEPPCHTLRVSIYGRHPNAETHLEGFIDSLLDRGEQAEFHRGEAERLTPAPVVGTGRCAEPILVDLDEENALDITPIGDLLLAYTQDRSAGTGFEACFTVAGLAELQAAIDSYGDPYVVRPADIADDGSAQALATYFIDDTFLLYREQLGVVALPDGDRHRLLFSSFTAGPDSFVGEQEAVAFVDEYLTRLATEDFVAAAELLFEDGRLAGEVAAVLGAMTDVDQVARALAAYCADALCYADYEIGTTGAFDADHRSIVVTWLVDPIPFDSPIMVSVSDGQLAVGTLPPREP